MKAFPTCPICQSKFRQVFYSKGWLEECCMNDDCPGEYRQFFIDSFQSGRLSYVRFYTKNFLIYSHFEEHTMFPGITHIYQRNFPRGEGTQKPAYEVKNLNLDFSNLEKLDNKYLTYNLFLW